MERWQEIDTILREIKKNNPTKFKQLEDDVDMFGHSPLPKFRNLLNIPLNSIMPLTFAPIELESGHKKMDITAGELGTWMTVSRAGALAFGMIKHTLLSSVLHR